MTDQYPPRPESGPEFGPGPEPTYVPQYPSPTAPPRRKSKAPVWLVVAVSVALAVCCLGGTVAGVAQVLNSGSEVTAEPGVDPEPQPAEAVGDEPEAEEETPEGPAAMQIGETGTYAEAGSDVGELTVTEADRFTSPRSEYGEPPDNDEFVLVTVNAKAIGDGLYSINPFDFYLRDAEGRQYEYANGSSLFAVDSTLSHTDLNPGEQVTGDLVFDVPAAPMELVYAPGWSRSLAFWEIP